MQGIFDESLIGEQLDRETRAVNEGVARYRKLARQATERGEGASLKPAELLMLRWAARLTGAIRQEQRLTLSGKPGMHRRIWGAALCSLPADKQAVLTLHVVLGECLRQPWSLDLSRLVETVGRAVNGQFALPQVRADDEAWEALTHTDRRQLRPEKILTVSRKMDLPGVWTRKCRIQLGACLCRCLFEVAELDGEPAFDRKAMRKSPTHTWYRVRLSDAAMKFIDDGHSYRQYLRPLFGMMVVPPLPWRHYGDGGYLKIRLGLVKHPPPSHRARLVEADLSKVLAGVNALQSAAWRINTPMLEIIQTLWDSGGRFRRIPRREPVPLPEAPPGVDTDAKIKRAFRRERAGIYRQNVLELGERTTFSTILAQAQDLASREAFWAPHQLDQRQRIYPVPLYLNHHGDDVCRGLMEFAEPKPLTDDGIAALKVHLANVAGIKGTIAQRIGWVDASANAIDAWVDDPLGNTGWAAEDIDDPFQTLAAARALVDGGPTGIPVAMDGTCNALQHYAALGRSREDARRVGLVPGDLATEPYSAIAALAAERVARDAAAGVETAQALVGHVSRKLVKQPCMTKLYNVTAYGAARQVSEFLRDNLPEIAEDKRFRGRMAHYLSRIAVEAMRETCGSAGLIMDWLATAAEAIVETRRVVSWITPLGFPVEQPYRQSSPVVVSTVLHHISMARDTGSLKPHHRRQIQAFPPNYIHSLDSSHMLITAQLADHQGLTIAGVHDSFWTHASDAPQLKQIIQDSFYALHKLPLLKNLYEQLAVMAPDAALTPPPPAGDWDVSDALDAYEAFS
jgi:DNA-directed RNA polymerase, mitochondrial